MKDITDFEQTILLDQTYGPVSPTQPISSMQPINWYIAKFSINNYVDVVHWCKEQFGDHSLYPDAWSRWSRCYNRIQFRYEKDYIWFCMKWGI